MVLFGGSEAQEKADDPRGYGKIGHGRRFCSGMCVAVTAVSATVQSAGT